MDSLRRIFWIARNTFVEAVRQKFFGFLLVLGCVLICISASLTSFDFGNSELKFIADFGFGGIFLFGSALAIVMTVQLFFTEIENRTALTLLAKPARRAEFLLGKFLGLWSLLGVFIALMSVLLAAVLAWRFDFVAAVAEARGVPAPILNFGGLAVFAFLQWIRLGIVAMATMAISSFAQTYLYAVVVSFCALLIGQLQYLFQDLAGDEKLSVATKIAAGTALKLIPNLQLFNLGESLVLESVGVPAGTVLSAAGYGALWIAALGIVGAWLFRFREI